MDNLPNRRWTRDEVEKALRLYCLTPFGKIHTSNADIINLASELGRSASSVSMKMLNLAAIDPTIQQKGMSNFSKLDEEVWKDFFEGRLTFEAEPETIPGLAASSFASGTDYEGASIVGHDVIVTAKARRGQAYFRGMILSSYRGCCALSGVNTADLLVASHIVPWAENKSLRMNPTNGICLNVFLDKAFDRGLMTFDHDFRVVLSDRMSMETKAYFQSFLGTQLKMPDRFLPSQDNLEIHRTRVFR